MPFTRCEVVQMGSGTDGEVVRLEDGYEYDRGGSHCDYFALLTTNKYTNSISISDLMASSISAFMSLRIYSKMATTSAKAFALETV